jgi:hypothetical protein
MGGFLSVARNRSGLTWPKLNVCECNANVNNDGDRPGFFKNLALWLYNNGGRRMLTFFPDPAGPHSVTWEHVADAAVPYNHQRPQRHSERLRLRSPARPRARSRFRAGEPVLLAPGKHLTNT